MAAGTGALTPLPFRDKIELPLEVSAGGSGGGPRADRAHPSPACIPILSPVLISGYTQRGSASTPSGEYSGPLVDSS